MENSTRKQWSTLNPDKNLIINQQKEQIGGDRDAASTSSNNSSTTNKQFNYMDCFDEEEASAPSDYESDDNNDIQVFQDFNENDRQQINDDDWKEDKQIKETKLKNNYNLDYNNKTNNNNTTNNNKENNNSNSVPISNKQKLSKILKVNTSPNTSSDLNTIYEYETETANSTENNNIVVMTEQITDQNSTDMVLNEIHSPSAFKVHLVSDFNYLKSNNSENIDETETDMTNDNNTTAATTTTTINTANTSNILEWLKRAEEYLSPNQPTIGDYDTVSLLMDYQRAFDDELQGKKSLLNKAKENIEQLDENGKKKLEEIIKIWNRVTIMSNNRNEKLKDAMKIAKELNESVEKVREWLPRIEHELKHKSIPEDENAILALIDNHDKFFLQLKAEEINIENIRQISKKILENCHPNAVRFIKYYLTITSTRWDQAIARCQQRAEKLKEALSLARRNATLINDLLEWVMETQTFLTAKQKDSIPDDIAVVEVLVHEHMELTDEINEKQTSIDQAIKSHVSNDTANSKSIFGSTKNLHHIDSDSPSHKAQLLSSKWKTLCKVTVEREKVLYEKFESLIEMESIKNFNFEVWRKRYVEWIREQKMRIMDFFRRRDKNGYGTVTRAQFVEGMMSTKFTSNKTELNAVFDLFDKNHTGELNYTEFAEALKPERKRVFTKNYSEADLVCDVIEEQVGKCRCKNVFRWEKIAETKYKFGDKQKVCLVKYLNKTVMVRVGGGWITLAAFLYQNDPCRATIKNNQPERPTTPKSVRISTPEIKARSKSPSPRLKDGKLTPVKTKSILKISTPKK